MTDYLEDPALLTQRLRSQHRLSLHEMAQKYSPDPQLRDAINEAIDAGKPLLISGGTSDWEISLPAYYTAFKLGSELFHFRTRHDSTAKDILYQFDSVAYLHEAQTASREQLIDKRAFMQKGILWIAAERGYSEKKPMVLLIDALDRAPAGFLEDLLLELDLLSFTVSETAERVEFSQEYGPIVFLAGNNLDKIDPYIKGQCLSYVVPASLSRPMEAILPDRKSTVFISYAHEDSDTASRIYSDLKNRGIGVWLDSQDLLPGQKWEVEIKKVMRSCTYVIALLSDNSVSKKGFVQKELKFALDLLDEVPVDDVFVIPVRITKCIPNDERLQTLHWADLFQDYDNGLDKILRVLESKNRTREAQQ